MKIGICIAHNYPSFSKEFTISLFKMQYEFYNWVYKNERDDSLSLFIQGGYNLDRMRDDVATEALNAGMDALLLLDTDQDFPAFTISRMIEVLEANKDFEAVTGIYTLKKEPYYPQIFGRFDEKKKMFNRTLKFPLDQPFEIAGAGTGVVMIKKEAFERIKKPYFKFLYKGESKELPNGMGEDLYFFWKARPKMLCDPVILCGHYDTRPVGLANYISKNKLRLDKDNRKILMTKKEARKMEKKYRR